MLKVQTKLIQWFLLYYISDSIRKSEGSNFNPTCYDYNTKGSLTVTSAWWHNNCGCGGSSVAETYQDPCDNYYTCSVPVGINNLPNYYYTCYFSTLYYDVLGGTRYSTRSCAGVCNTLDSTYTCKSKYLTKHKIIRCVDFVVNMKHTIYTHLTSFSLNYKNKIRRCDINANEKQLSSRDQMP